MISCESVPSLLCSFTHVRSGEDFTFTFFLAHIHVVHTCFRSWPLTPICVPTVPFRGDAVAEEQSVERSVRQVCELCTDAGAAT